MKKRWTIFAAILIVIAISALATYESNDRQEVATEDIINRAALVDEIKITNKEKIIRIKGEEVTDYIEKTPLVHIEKYERPDRKYFEKEATYTIEYSIDGEVLYAVDLLSMKDKPTDDHLEDFLINEHLLVKWSDYQMLFSQHEQIIKAIDYFKENK